MPGLAGHEELDRAYFTRAGRRFRVCAANPATLPVSARGPAARLSTAEITQLCDRRKSPSAGINTVVRNCQWTGSIMNLANFCRRVIIGDQVVAPGASTGFPWLFIALVALFLTHPDAEPRSHFDRPLPLPAELNLERPFRPAPSRAVGPATGRTDFRRRPNRLPVTGRADFARAGLGVATTVPRPAARRAGHWPTRLPAHAGTYAEPAHRRRMDPPRRGSFPPMVGMTLRATANIVSAGGGTRPAFTPRRPSAPPCESSPMSHSA
jgi:hypothetical protein